VELVVVEQRAHILAVALLHRRVAVQVEEQLLRAVQAHHAPQRGIWWSVMLTQTFFGSQNTSKLQVPPSRPVPDALVPPNGCRRSRTFWLLTKHIPASTAAATRCALAMSRVQT